MKPRDGAKLLGNVGLFSELTPRQLGAIARAAKEQSRPEGTVLAREGEQGVGFFLIVDGEAEVSQRGRRLATLGVGDYFGEIALLDNRDRTATVTAKTPVRLLGLTAWTFRSLIKEYPSIALKLLEVLAAHLRRTAKESF